MPEINIREMTTEDASVVVSLNQAVVDVTSPMDLTRFGELYEISTLKRSVEIDDQVVAFILGMESNSSYKNDNYAWFSARIKSFLYIDRVVVSERCRGLGVGRLLYSQMQDHAVRTNASTICAEVTLEPPNHQSLQFHRKAGFEQIGIRVVDDGKQLSMLARPVAAVS
ncbi:Acetyltransferase (GNAT) family protein [Roseimaritima multifibrata]|uniref:Acetyltransferase (GNAT) family protein n=1 Tax=Roseimaritima multifibrata TaxID=1930274 RepID=A0A517MAP8_9BACT|nr:GNAT family N-acetyltransferase [Roseimaritima multifibrata]QDS91962.1 Acetyltransferase (GNAT) family protein [Roseimaritima multifibrata]